MIQKTTICVCGAGTMGSGIAQVFAQNNFRTILYDLNREMLHKAQSKITNDLQQLVGKKKINAEQKAMALSLISFTDQLQECKAHLIIEAVSEDLQIKRELINSLFSLNANDTIIVTNTSSLPVSEIATGISAPDRFAGMHFFNPAPVMKLIELVTTVKTSETTITFLSSLSVFIGKIAVKCIDSPGFIVNRVARPYYAESLYLVEKNIASIGAIDELMESTGFRMGPFRLMDMIGNDINFSVTNIIYDALGKPERLKPSAIQEIKVKEGHLGRKTGKGYYDYPTQ